MYKLVKMKKDYADEFNCEAFVAIQGEELINQFLSELNDLCHNAEIEVYFGSNEYLYDFDLTEFTIVDITETEYEALKRTFGKNGSDIVAFGTGSRVFSQLLENF